MVVFSKRNGYEDCSLKLESVSDAIKGRILGVFYREEYNDADWLHLSTTGIEDMMIEMGIPYEFPDNRIVKSRNASKLEKYILKSEEWYLIFDFVEKYLFISNDETREKMTKEFNRILEEEVSAYRILDGMVIPITSKSELSTIEEAINIEYESVKTHISKALTLYADRKKPDYENSIKESISAVESMCCIITGLTGGTATLGKALKKLKDNGVHIHSAMESSFLSLYGYTSDENGIRHGGIDFTNAPSEDAKYMLVSCSAFVNYLMEKWRKVKDSIK